MDKLTLSKEEALELGFTEEELVTLTEGEEDTPTEGFESDETEELDTESPEEGLDDSEGITEGLEEESTETQEVGETSDLDVAKQLFRGVDFDAAAPQPTEPLDDVDSPEYSQAQRNLQRLKDKNPVNTLYQDQDLFINGKHVLEVDNETLNAHVAQLEDEGKVSKVLKLGQARQEYQNWLQEVQGAYQDQQYWEWQGVGQAVVKKLPSLNQHMSLIKEYLGNALQDARVSNLASTKEGKLKLVGAAIKDLALLQPATTKEEQKESLPPDANVTQKKITPSKPSGKNKRFTREQINNMSLDEFAKNEAAIDEAIRLGLVE